MSLKSRFEATRQVVWWVMPIGGLAFCAAEWLTLVVLRFSRFANAWELQLGTLWLFPTLALLAAGVTLVWAAVLWAAWSQRRRGLLVSIAVVAMAGAWLGFELTHGRHFELWWRRVGFIALLAASSGALIYVGHQRLRAWLTSAPLNVAVGASLMAVALELANRVLLVRLYPAFHVALAALSLGAAAIAALGLHRRWARPIATTAQPVLKQARVWAGAAALGLALSWVPSARAVSRFDNFRWVISQDAPLWGLAVQGAARIAPPPDIGPSEAGINDPKRESAQLGLRNRDILLITVDALRADHLGAYGYTRPTSPNMDALAKEGVLFENAYCATPHTSYSVVSLMTGKYMRPLLMQQLGQDSETWAEVLRRYGYRTAAFYPPAIFFIDPERFRSFDERQLGFEYQKREFLEGAPRVAQVTEYVDAQPSDRPLFVWLHLFGPHEPYDRHPEYDFGDLDIDRYDAEIRAADETIGAVVRAFRAKRPNAVVILTADHGEEFGDHGGRYHGSSVYEEQVRVPLVIATPGLQPNSITPPVQSIDLLPTILSALDIPVRPRIRGNNLTPLLVANAQLTASQKLGFAYAETDEQALVAEGHFRLLCLRRIGACQLFDLEHDPQQRVDVSTRHPDIAERLRSRLRALNSDHGRFEQVGARAESSHWPGPILRGIAGDADAAIEVAGLLDDADVQIRRKAAEVLFDLSAPETVTPLRLALQRDEDFTVRAYSALSLTRLGEGASMTRELLESDDQFWRRRAALALAESGERKGSDELLAWWMDDKARDFEVSKRLLAAFAAGKVKDAVWPLSRSLEDLRLRPFIAQALAEIGDDSARNSLLMELKREPYQTNRVVLAQALLKLGANNELVVPLRRWLGVPDPLVGGVGIALSAGILEHLGGPTGRDLQRLQKNSNLGQLVRVVVPKTGNGDGIRVFLRATNHSSQPLTARVGAPRGVFSYDSKGQLVTSRKIPEIDPERQVVLEFPPGSPATEQYALAPSQLRLEPGHASFLVVFAEHGLEVEALAAVPLQDEIGIREATDAPAHASKKDAPASDEARNSTANE